VVATEEPLALIAFGVAQGEHRKALMVLAPRKPERFEAAAAFVTESQRKYVRRSNLNVPAPGGQAFGGNETQIGDDVAVLLLDSIGELASLYRLADGVFVGGSLVESGGHNILEPAAFGKVPVFGESMENFAEISERFVAAEAAIQVASPEDAGVSWIELLRDPARDKRMGETGRRLMDESRGTTDRAVAAIRTVLAGEKSV
jgi:3-deoxy-D-manno-octulosonic-acid transferase